MSSDHNMGKSFDLNFFKNLRSKENHGYLVCHNCYGYYPLKENELPDDFTECECGNDLEFCENIEDFIKTRGLKDSDVDKNDPESGDHNELQEMTDVLKSKSEKRKEFFKELSARIEIQEEVLKEINYGEKGLWDTIEETKPYNHINVQPIVENTVLQENNLLSYIKEQRSRAEHIENSPGHYFIVLSAFLLVISAIMLTMLLLRIT